MDALRIYSRTFALLLALILCAGFLLACAKDTAVEEPIDQPLVSDEPTQAPTVPVSNKRSSQLLVGFIIPDTQSIMHATFKHGFLRTAENLGYPCKLYYADEGEQSVSAVVEAKNDGCAGILIWSPDGSNDKAIEKAAELSLPVVVPYHTSDSDSLSSNVVADVNGYMEEVALGVAERMVERSCKAGKILVYGSDFSAVYSGFTQAISEYYPQYTVAGFKRTAQGQDEAIEELATYILWNRDVKGMFCIDADGAIIAVKARELATRRFRSDGAPEKKAGAIPPPGVKAYDATPAPDGLTSQILISVAGYGYSEDNVSLLRSNDIYAFVLEPYYLSTAQSLMLLDRIINGESVPKSYRLNMPIVRMSSLDKYVLIDEQAREWFGM